MIGIICKAEEGIEALGKNWVPEAFSMSDLKTGFHDVLGIEPSGESFSYESEAELIHFTVDDLSDPRAISFSCSRSPENEELISRVAKALQARVYDSESGGFL